MSTFCPGWLLVGKGLTLTGKGSTVWKVGVNVAYIDIYLIMVAWERHRLESPGEVMSPFFGL